MCTLCTEKSRHVLNKKLTAENQQRKQGKQKNPMKIEKETKKNENRERKKRNLKINK